MSLSRAKSLYKQKKYLACAQECIATIENNQDKIESYSLAAKAYLFLLKHPIDDSDINTFTSTAKKAILACTSAKEVYDVRYDIKQTLYDWKAEFFEQALKQLESNPCLEQFKTFLPCKSKIAELDLFLLMALVHPNMKALAEKEGLTTQEAEKRYSREPDNDVSKDMFYAMQFSSAQRIFPMIQNYIDNNYNTDPDRGAEVAKTAVDALLMLDDLLSFGAPENPSETASQEEMTAQLCFYAEVLTYLMNATLNLGGHAISIYMGDRQQTYNKIRQIYRRIQTYDPTYVSPPLPNVEAISPPPASGGCYVATAVYGSYDCPEVWTLRRFRDDILASSLFGRAFIHTYYAISPTLVKWFGDTRWFRSLWKGRLDRLVSKLQQDGIESTPYQDKEW